MRLKALAIVFITIAVILAVVGYVIDDYLFYIRAVIFTIGGAAAWWLDETGYADRFNEGVLGWWRRR